MGMFSAFNVNASGLTAQRYRMDIISENVANANTTRTEDGTPYRRKVVTFEEKGSQTTFSKVLGHASAGYTGSGVKVSRVYEDNVTEMNMVYDPSHPDADACEGERRERAVSVPARHADLSQNRAVDGQEISR